MKTIAKIIRHFVNAYRLYREGYYFTESIQKSDNKEWGFVRLNYAKDGKERFALVDMDFKTDTFSCLSAYNPKDRVSTHVFHSEITE